MSNIEDDVISQEAFYELIDSFEVVSKLTMYGRKSIKHYVKKMQAELEQKDKRIQELERKNKHLSNTSDYETISLECTHLEEQLDIANSRIQELEEENNKTQIISPYYVKGNYIPKQVVKDKIEELKNNLKYIDCNSDCSKCFNEEGKALYRGSNFVFCYAYHQIKILQELLEGERK